MRLLLFSLCFCSPFSLFAQNRVMIEMLPPLIDQKIKLPFSGVEVIDARFDTTYIGAFAKGFTFRQQTVYKQEADFPGSFKNYFPHVLGRIIEFDQNSPDKLVLLVKRFRLADHIDRNKTDPELILNISISFFARKDNYYFKLNTLDKIFSVPMVGAHKKKELDSFRTKAFGNLLEIVFKERSWKKTNTVFTTTDIKSGIDKRFDLPIFTDSVIRVGCYRNFNEFIMNRPSITNVKPVYKEILTSFKTEDGKLIPVDSCWGGSDGRNVFIVFRKTYCMLFLRDHSFVLRSYRSTADIKPPPDYGTAALQYGLIDGMLKAGIDWEPEVFYLNMENGSVFLEEVLGVYTKLENQKDILRKKI
jgi:hypothetical protein